MPPYTLLPFSYPIFTFTPQPYLFPHTLPMPSVITSQPFTPRSPLIPYFLSHTLLPPSHLTPQWAVRGWGERGLHSSSNIPHFSSEVIWPGIWSWSRSWTGLPSSLRDTGTQCGGSGGGHRASLRNESSYCLPQARRLGCVCSVAALQHWLPHLHTGNLRLLGI